MTDSRLEASLLLMRMTIAAFLLVWAVDKLVSPEHAQAVFANFYRVDDLSPMVLYAIGVAQIVVILAFAAGAVRFWSYGAVLLMHLGSTLSTFPHLVRPWGPDSQLLFWAAVPVLAAMIALFALRDRDRLASIDAAFQGH